MSYQIRTITIGTAIIGVGYPNGASEFSTPNTILCSYADPTRQISNDVQSPTLNWQGMPISISQFLDPILFDPSTGDTIGETVGNFFAIDVIESIENPSIESLLNTSDIDDPGVAQYAVWNGNKIQISTLNSRYYLNTINTGLTAEPQNKIIFQGTPQATGISNELIFNDSGFTISDIDTDPNNGEIDYKSISLGGIPIAVGRVGFKYYLIINPVSEP